MILSAQPIPQAQASQRALPFTPKAQGIVLEHQLAAALATAGIPFLRGQWFSAQARPNGQFYAQPDFILPQAAASAAAERPIVVIECKRIVYPSSWTQLALYLAIVQKAYGVPTAGFIATSNRPRRGRFITAQTLSDAIKLCQQFPRVVLEIITNNGATDEPR